MLSHRCGVNIPRLKVEMLKGHCGKFGKPFIILREFYHHLRTFGVKHKGTEKMRTNSQGNSSKPTKIFKHPHN
ncbi:MAG: hypothetical protein QW629_01645, partial [Candidatus Bathyarchaeia archaeon]